MVGAVAHHVRERITHQLQHLPVQLGLLPPHLQHDLLAGLLRQIPHQPRQLVPGRADRLHPGPHDPFLQFACNQIQTLRRGTAGSGLRRSLEKLIPCQHQFAHQIH